MGHYIHPFTEGDLVRDTEFGETFVFADRIDGRRAQQHPEKVRMATPAEAEQFKHKHPDTPFNPIHHG